METSSKISTKLKNFTTWVLTEDKVVKEYADVILGIGTFCGDPFHINLASNAILECITQCYLAQSKRIIIEVIKHHGSVPTFYQEEGWRWKFQALCMDLHDPNKVIYIEPYYYQNMKVIIPKFHCLESVTWRNDAGWYPGIINHNCLPPLLLPREDSIISGIHFGTVWNCFFSAKQMISCCKEITRWKLWMFSMFAENYKKKMDSRWILPSLS